MSKVLLVLGPTGAGKTTLIWALQQLDERFVYVRPMTTRPLRTGETDKTHVSDEELSKMQRRGEFIAVNRLYDARYATPRRPIEVALSIGVFPMLDWPITQMATMWTAFPGRLFSVYVEPPSLAVLQQRLSDGRDVKGTRLESAIGELRALAHGAYDHLIDCRVANGLGDILTLARHVYWEFMEGCEETAALAQEPRERRWPAAESRCTIKGSALCQVSAERIAT